MPRFSLIPGLGHGQGNGRRSAGTPPPASHSSTGPGFFGKMPGTGDFVRHGLPGHLISRFDDCFTDAMDLGRRRFGKEWPLRFGSSPAWRFAIPAPEPGTATLIGMAVASTDRVGRPYPLAALASLPPPLSPAVAPFACDAWFTGVHAALTSVTGGGLGPGHLAALLRELGPPQPDPAFDDSLCRTLLEEHTGPIAARSGLWWTFGNEPGDACLLAWPGWLPVDRMSAILAGDWNWRMPA